MLDECAQTYRCLLDAEFSLHSIAVSYNVYSIAICFWSYYSASAALQELSFNQLVDELVENFKQYLTDCKDQSLVSCAVSQWLCIVHCTEGLVCV